MTIRDLLTMTCGHDTASSVNTQATETPAKDWVEQFLAHPVEHKRALSLLITVSEPICFPPLCRK